MKKRGHNFRTLLALTGFLLGLLFTYEVALADGIVRSPFAFQLSHSVFDAPEFDILPLLRGKQPFTMPDTTFQDEAPVLVSGISGEVTYRLKPASSKLILGAEQAVVSEEISAVINIRQVTVDAVVEKMVAGVLLRVRIQGSCSNVPVGLQPGRAKLMATIKAGVAPESGRPYVSVPWMGAQWSDDAWTIGDFSCVGFEGFQDKVKVGLKNYLKNPDAVLPGIKAMVDNQVVRLQNELTGRFFAPRVLDTGVEGVGVVMYPRWVGNLSATGFQLFGDLDFVFAHATVNETSVLPPLQAPAALSNYSVAIPEELIGALNAMAFKTGRLGMLKRGQEMAAFKNFMNSSLSQYYVWPMMSRYRAEADFVFDAMATEIPRLGALADSGKGYLTGQMAGRLSVLTWAPTAGGGHEKMLTFDSSFSGTYRVSVAATTGLKLVFTTLSHGLSAKWDATYVKVRSADTSIDTTSIGNAITDSLKTDGVSISLGTLELTSKLKLKPTALGKQKNVILLQLAH